jgi:transcriptional regulator with XRE-family HTH domain
MTFAKAFGHRVGMKRTELGITQETLADRAGMHITTVNQIECGRGGPSVESLLRLAAGLGCDPGELLAGVDWEPAGLRVGPFS